MLPVVCGNGVVQGDEECDCASGTECLFCSQCILESGKECTPDSPIPCCDSQGNFLTTDSSCTLPGGATGYCNAGECASMDQCNIDLTVGNEVVSLDQFCGVSEDNPCKTKCGSSSSSDICYDTSDFESGGVDLEDGAFCMNGANRGLCNSGVCDVDIVCGNGAIQPGEECECAVGTSCR